MDWKKESKALFIIFAVFLGMFFLPVGVPRFDNAIFEALQLVKWYAREHVLLCLIPAFFIASAIGVFVRQASVMMRNSKILDIMQCAPQAAKCFSPGRRIMIQLLCHVILRLSGIWRNKYMVKSVPCNLVAADIGMLCGSKHSHFIFFRADTRDIDYIIFDK